MRARGDSKDCHEQRKLPDHRHCLEAFDPTKNLQPSIGIFDIGMPDINGYELAERIRHEAWGKAMTLIAVTGWGQESDKRRAFLAGFDHHLVKPVDPDQIEELFDGNVNTP